MKNGLLDFLQSASNSVAGNVAGPVDLIGMGLRSMGVPVPQNAMGSSEWMKKKGLMRDVPQGPARVLGETAGLLGPVMATQFAPQIGRGLLQAGDNLAAPATMNKQTGAIVWHGSPHKFDKFDSSKIGTGEGAQAYGHGLYLAESPDVAKQYKAALSGPDSTVVGGKPLAVMGLSSDAQSFVNQAAAKVQRGGNLSDEIAALEMNIKYGHPNAAQMQEAISALRGGVDRGSLYKVDLPDDQIAKMLDWDKPLSQQAPVKQSWQKENADWMGAFEGGTGKDLLQQVRNRFDGDEAATVEYLRKQGIPGIRYLDGGSRGAGIGSSNFVVFPGNEGLLSILERNGVPLK